MDLPPLAVAPQHEPFARSVLAGLSTTPKTLEPRWLYDTVGAKLFEAITQLDHYYVTRTELALIESAALDIADELGTGVGLVEPGSGEALKVRPLLAALGTRAARYVPVDIARHQLEAVAAEMAALYPGLHVEPVAADFLRPFALPPIDNAVVFFPGSTIGNMAPQAAVALLRRLLDGAGARRLLVGFDLIKERKVMLEAYDDPAGVTAAFTRNILQRINRELGGTFDLSRFAYRCRFDEASSAIEMALVSQGRQSVSVAGHPVVFADGEAVRTEESRKFTVAGFAELARGAGLEAVRTWTDEREWFALMLLERTA